MELGKDEKFETWAIVEIMGHQRIAGHVTEQTIAGTPLLRVDVPEIPAGVDRWGSPAAAVAAFTTFIGGGSIYRLTPCTEQAARAAVGQFREQPVQCVDLQRPALPAAEAEESPDRGLEDDFLAEQEQPEPL
jgi:hypothetical protein